MFSIHAPFWLGQCCRHPHNSAAFCGTNPSGVDAGPQATTQLGQCHMLRVVWASAPFWYNIPHGFQLSESDVHTWGMLILTDPKTNRSAYQQSAV
jgi:hypothetical protein